MTKHQTKTKSTEKWIVCPVCKGEGTTVNPNIDCHGLTPSDFDDDPDLAEAYFKLERLYFHCQDGDYDIPCNACSGRRVVHPSHLRTLRDNAADRRLAAMEDGDWEAYSVSSDWRFG